MCLFVTAAFGFGALKYRMCICYRCTQCTCVIFVCAFMVASGVVGLKWLNLLLCMYTLCICICIQFIHGAHTHV